MFNEKVVVKLLDGTILKGYSSIFFPTDKAFEVMSLDNRIHFLEVSKVFAVFFVKDFEGNPNRDRTRATSIMRSFAYGTPVIVTLTSGEKIPGKTSGERGKSDLGMFLHPVDPNDNNINIYFPLAAVKSVESMPDPEESTGKRPPHPAMRR